MRISLLLSLALVPFISCRDDVPNYGDEHQTVGQDPGFHWPTTGRVIEDFYGKTSRGSEFAGSYYDRDGEIKYHDGSFPFHRGVDVENATGTRVYAAKLGDVVRVIPWDGRSISGNMVKIWHGGGWWTIYAHLDTIEVVEGQRVTADTVIGRMGATSSNPITPHLHFAYHRIWPETETCPAWTPGIEGQMVTSGARIE